MELSTHYTRTGRSKPTTCQELGISPILGKLLVERGITMARTPGSFSAPNYRTYTTHS